MRDSARSRFGAKGPTLFSTLGEWRASIGEYKDKSGVRQIITTGPPFAGLTFWPQTNEGKPALLFETPQQKYLFTR